jgi:hypothetical protein
MLSSLEDYGIWLLSHSSSCACGAASALLLARPSRRRCAGFGVGGRLLAMRWAFCSCALCLLIVPYSDVTVQATSSLILGAFSILRVIFFAGMPAAGSSAVHLGHQRQANVANAGGIIWTVRDWRGV